MAAKIEVRWVDNEKFKSRDATVSLNDDPIIHANSYTSPQFFTSAYWRVDTEKSREEYVRMLADFFSDVDKGTYERRDMGCRAFPDGVRLYDQNGNEELPLEILQDLDTLV